MRVVHLGDASHWKRQHERFICIWFHSFLHFVIDLLAMDSGGVFIMCFYFHSLAWLMTLFFSISSTENVSNCFSLNSSSRATDWNFSLLTLNLPSNQTISKHTMLCQASVHFIFISFSFDWCSEPCDIEKLWKQWIVLYSHIFNYTYLRFQLINF